MVFLQKQGSVTGCFPVVCSEKMADFCRRLWVLQANLWLMALTAGRHPTPALCCRGLKEQESMHIGMCPLLCALWDSIHVWL